VHIALSRTFQWYQKHSKRFHNLGWLRCGYTKKKKKKTHILKYVNDDDLIIPMTMIIEIGLNR
jgi:DNA-binding transcriptional regulator of glucitol operon